jgi:glycosyltransferase involved in cell wall biosynthesis
MFNLWSAVRSLMPDLDLHIATFASEWEFDEKHVRALERFAQTTVFCRNRPDKPIGSPLEEVFPALWRHHCDTDLWLHIQGLCADAHHDTRLVAEMEQMMPYVDAGVNAVRKVLVVHEFSSAHYYQRWRDADTGNPEKQAFLELYRSVGPLEKSYMPRFDSILCFSQEDAHRVGMIVPGERVGVMPLAVDHDAISGSVHIPERSANVVGFFGSYIHEPNRDAVEFFLGSVWPLVLDVFPEAGFRIHGSYIEEEWAREWRSHPGVDVVGYVENISDAIARCQVIAVPVVSGSGTRTKFLEALGVGRPVVTTSLGAQGIEVKDREGCLVADDPAEMAGAIVELLRDPEKASRVALAGKNAVLRHDSKVVAAEMLAHLGLR